MDAAQLRPLSQAAHHWLRDQAWPLWLQHGIDRDRGGFHEQLSPATLTCAADFRRLRVAARQIYVFAAAARENIPGAKAAVLQGCDFLCSRARQSDGGYAWRFDLAGNPTDLTRDLYDHAFVLLAWSSAATFLPSGAGLRSALELDHYLQDHFRHPAGGYAEALPDASPRRQNPHMHLLEAYLHAAQTWQSAHFFSRAEELISLFLDRLFQHPEGALPEYFDDNLSPLRDAGRFMAEPGHHAEWIWLLDWYRTLAPQFGATIPAALAPTAASLARFLDLPACHTRFGALVDEMWSDGTVRAATARLWPQTERLKSELLSPHQRPGKIHESFDVLSKFTEDAPRGLWHERWSEDQGFSNSPAPASSLYHLTAAILFARRRLEGVGKFD